MTQFQCPLSGLVGGNLCAEFGHDPDEVSMPFKRAGWWQPKRYRKLYQAQRFQCPLSGLVGCNLLRPLRLRDRAGFNAL